MAIALARCSPSSQSLGSGAPAETTSGGVASALPSAPSASTAPAVVATALPTAASTATAAATATAATPSGEPLPAFATLRKIFLRQEQGGPSIRRCNGIAYELEIDLTANALVYRLCDPDAKGPEGSEPLTPRRSKLGSVQKAELERAYAKLTHEPARGCGKDGGTLSLTVTPRSGKTERWVDQNWGCVKPPPEVALGLREFMMAATSATSAEE